MMENVKRWKNFFTKKLIGIKKGLTLYDCAYYTYLGTYKHTN